MTLGFSLLINICLGFTYTWSVFVASLTEHLGSGITEVTFTYTIATLMFTVMTVAGGRIQDRFGPVMAIRIGALLFGGGLVLCGFTSSLAWLYFFYGIVVNGGIGMAYCAVLMNINNFYPQKRGSVSGLITASYGMSAVLFSPIATFLISAYGVLNTYRILGIFFFLTLSFSSLFVRKAPSVDVKLADIYDKNANDKTWDQMIKTPAFYIIFSLMVIGSTAGLMIISQASLIAQNMMGASVTTAAFTLSLIAGANALGRILWGFISDKTGRNTSTHLIFLIAASMMLGLSFISRGQYTLFTVITMLIAFCYGGVIGTFPAIITEYFGAKNNGTNYGLILLGAGVGSFIGPMTAAWTQTLTPGYYGTAFYISSALGFIGLILTFILRKYQYGTSS